MNSKIKRRIFLIVIGIICVIIGTPIILIIIYGYDHVVYPISHIRNEKYVVNYTRETFGFGTSANKTLTLVKLDTFFNNDKTIVFIDPSRGASIKRYEFISQDSLRIVVTGMNVGFKEYVIDLRDYEDIKIYD